MFVLMLLACDPGGALGTPSSDGSPTDGATDPEGGPPDSAIASCLADGGAMVELAASTAWSAPLAGLALAGDGTLHAVTLDGHLLTAPGGDLAALTDRGAVGAYGEFVDVTGDLLLVDASGVSVGPADADPADWQRVPGAWGDSAVSPDGADVAFALAVCGVDYGIIHVADGTRGGFDPASSDHLPLGFEYLADGRLAAATYTGAGRAGLAVYAAESGVDGPTIEEAWAFDGAAEWEGRMETLGDTVLLPTGGDYLAGTLERVDLATGASTSTPVPFSSFAAVALDARLSWALGHDGHVVVVDGEAVYDLGTWADAIALVAAPDGQWIATAGADGVIRQYGCE